MGYWLALLFLPALVLWGIGLANMLRAMQDMRHDQPWTSRINPLTWLSEWRRETRFGEAGQRAARRAQQARRWFLWYCLFLLVVLVVLGARAPG